MVYGQPTHGVWSTHPWSMVNPRMVYGQPTHGLWSTFTSCSHQADAIELLLARGADPNQVRPLPPPPPYGQPPHGLWSIVAGCRPPSPPPWGGAAEFTVDTSDPPS
eukprot:950478-Prorocentrum_minimum.AAC.1